MRLCTAKQIRALEQAAQEKHGIFPARLMDAAARALFDALTNDVPGKPEDVVILCGAGNNGADGYTLAALCRENGIRVSVISVFAPASVLCRERAFSCNTLSSPLFSFEGKDRVLCESLIEKASVIIDCVFGIGYDATRTPDSLFVDLCRTLSRSSAFVISADVPSGLDCDTGAFHRTSAIPALIFADLTVTFTASKPALETAPGLHAAGRVRVADVGIPPSLIEEAAPTAFLSDATLCAKLPSRLPDTSKANYGKLLSICGSRDMPGAAILAAQGALRCGVGLLTCAADEETLSVLKGRLCEAIYLPFSETVDGEIDLGRTRDLIARRLSSQSAVLIGCGMTTDREREMILESVLTEAACPVVCDADALTVLAAREDLLNTYGEKLILTPHPGEMGRLCHVSPSEVQLNRISLASAVAQKYGSVVVLKGHRTVIASPDGKLCINASGNPGMAKAGMGDLLAGIIASLAAQHLTPFDAACLGVYLHARAGDLACATLGEASLLPSDLPLYLARALTE